MWPQQQITWPLNGLVIMSVELQLHYYERIVLCPCSREQHTRIVVKYLKPNWFIESWGHIIKHLRCKKKIKWDYFQFPRCLCVFPIMWGGGNTTKIYTKLDLQLIIINKMCSSLVLLLFVGVWRTNIKYIHVYFIAMLILTEMVLRLCLLFALILTD